jgi:hypothetical protein
VKAKWICAKWAANGAFRNFDIDEAIKTSDRRIAEKALKKALTDGEEPGA